jgi:hypothetical protein
MSCINSINTATATDESYVAAQQAIQDKAPKNVAGELIYSADKVGSFILGTTLSMQQSIKNVLFSESAERSYVYENSFNNALIKLLSEDEINSLHDELRQVEGKAKMYNNKYVVLNKATKLELSEYISSQFLDYIAANQAIEDLTPTQEKVFEFLYKFYDNLDNSLDMFNSTTSGSIATVLSLKFDRRQTEKNGQMAQAGISPQILQYTNEGMAAIFMDALYRDSTYAGETIQEVLNYEDPEYFTGLYGNPEGFEMSNLSDPETVFDEVIAYYVSHYKDLYALKEKSLGRKKEMLETELKAIGVLVGISKGGLNVADGLLGQNWSELIESNVTFLKKYDLDVSLEKVGLQDSGVEDLIEEINSRDSIGIVADHQVSPLNRMSKEFKMLLKTLPEVDSRAKGSGYTFATNKVGLPRLSDFGQTLSVLYRLTANKPTLDSKIQAIVDHVRDEKDLKFQILLDRLSIGEGVIGDQTATSGELLLEFNTAMNNAENAYTLMQISDTGARNLINANNDSDMRIVKDKWSQNFKQNVRFKYGIVKDGTFVLGLDKTVTTSLGDKRKLKDLFLKGPVDLSQAFEFLGYLGIEFTNPDLVFQQVEDINEGDDFKELTHNLLKYLVESENNIAELYKEDQKGRLRELISLQLSTSKALGSLQFNGPTGKVYAISQKGFINVIADRLNSDQALFNELAVSPTMEGSYWAEQMYSPGSETKMEIGVLMGTVNTNNSESKDYSKMMRGDLTSAQVSSILDGFVPLIRTGNKKLEKTIRVGRPDYTETSVDMANRLAGYLRSEIITAHAIRSGAANNIKGIDKNGGMLQMFDDPKFEALKPMANSLIASVELDLNAVDMFVSNLKTIATLREYVDQEIVEVRDLLVEYNIVTKDNLNIGLDNNQLAAIGKTIGEDPSAKLSENLLNKVAEQLFIIRQTSLHEQFKFLLGHPAVYGDIFKRTSGLVGPKKYPPVDVEILEWAQQNYSNKGNPNRLIDGNVRMVTMQEVTETSEYLKDYKDILSVFNREDLYESLDDAYTDMEIFDGGGLVHIDFYRLARRLTSSWSQQDEEVYNKLIDGVEITPEEIALFDPLKPQVLAQAFEDKIDLRIFNKFALFPIHPGLSKTVTDIREGNSNILDEMYADMNKHSLDYIVMESAVKLGAKKEKATNKFSNLINEEGGYQSLSDLSSVQEYGLEYFGMQMDPKGKFGQSVTLGTQSTSMLPTNIFSNGMVAAEYSETRFSEKETWEEGITRYHNINKQLISREASTLASDLGFSYTPNGKFQFLGSQNKMLDTILGEMSKREIPENVQASIVDLFTREVTFAGQLFEKNKIETLFNAIVTNTVVRRKMNGNMVVLQSNFGYETTNKATKQSKDVAPERKLKTYGKDINPARLAGKSAQQIKEMKAAAPTTAMEVYLPHHYKEFLGQNIPPGTQISVKSLEAVGFRIPTEGLNSIEFIIIKDFLPQNAGNTIIVPSEIVAKSGADFDIDKLTLYFPNTTYNRKTKTIDVIPMIAASEAGATKLRHQDLNAYKSVWGKLLQRQPAELSAQIKQLDELYMKYENVKDLTSAIEADPQVQQIRAYIKQLRQRFKKATDIVERSKISAELDKTITQFNSLQAVQESKELNQGIEIELLKIDAKIIEAGFIAEAEKDILSIQPKKVLQNEMLFFITDVLRHPASFPQLITPVGAYGLAQKAKAIDEIVNPNNWSRENGKLVEKSKTLHQKLGFRNMIETTFTMYQTLGGTGIVATGITHAAKAQRAGLMWNSTEKRPISFKFKNYNRALSLSATKSEDTNRYINNEMQQYVTGYVDGEKDPFVMYVNAGQEGAAIHMLLLRSGVPLDDVLYFMSQPIITEYLKLKGTEQSLIMRAKGKGMTNEGIKNALKAKFPGTASDIEFDNELLTEMLPLKAGQMSAAQNSYQLQVLEDYLRYKEYANQLRNLQTVNAYDKTKLKNGAEVIDLEALAEVVKEDAYFVDGVTFAEDDLLKTTPIPSFQNKVVTESMLDPIEKVFKGTETLFKNVDLKNSKPEIKAFFVQKAKELIREGRFQEDRVYILNKFDNFMLTDITHGARINGVEIRSMANELFRGNASLPKIILNLQNSGESNNLVINNLLPLLDPHHPASFKSSTDNLKLVARKYDSYDLDQLTFAMEDLKETNPEIYNKLLVFSILQSGFDFNPNSFKQIIPGKDILDVTEDAFAAVDRMPNYAVDLPTVYAKFINNNWDNSRIVKQIYLKADKVNELEKDYLSGSSFRGAKYVTLHAKIGGKDSDVYQSNFYRLEPAYSQNGELDLTQSGYRRAPKMGKRNQLIETGNTSLLPANINPVPYSVTSAFNKEASEKIISREKTLHLSVPNSEVKPGRYVLSDGTKIKIVSLQPFTKITALMNNKTLLKAVDVTNKSQLAKKAGFNDYAHMAENLKGFVKNSSSVGLYQIQVEETGSAIFEDEFEDLADLTKNELLEDYAQPIIKNINEESQNC